MATLINQTKNENKDLKGAALNNPEAHQRANFFNSLSNDKKKQILENFKESFMICVEEYSKFSGVPQKEMAKQLLDGDQILLNILLKLTVAIQ